MIQVWQSNKLNWNDGEINQKVASRKTIEKTLK
jgi:hypothetical protein